jgi:hypothetical protein
VCLSSGSTSCCGMACDDRQASRHWWPATRAGRVGLAVAGFVLTFLSSVFDNIPRTALAIKQGGYDRGYLAFSVGFGGLMIWFGSSADVALSKKYPEAKSVGSWVKNGWPFAILGWKPDAQHKKRVELPAVQVSMGVSA